MFIGFVCSGVGVLLHGGVIICMYTCTKFALLNYWMCAVLYYGIVASSCYYMISCLSECILVL